MLGGVPAASTPAMLLTDCWLHTRTALHRRGWPPHRNAGTNPIPAATREANVRYSCRCIWLRIADLYCAPLTEPRADRRHRQRVGWLFDSSASSPVAMLL
jgi:hypothetical protein